MNYDHILSRLANVRPGNRPNLWEVSCPVAERHQGGDRRPSARVWVDEDSGRLEFWCAAGCKWKEAVAALGTKSADWYPQGGQTTLRPGRRVVARYDYTDESGSILYQSVRMEPKDFYQRRPVPGTADEWAYGTGPGFYKKGEGRGWHKCQQAEPGAILLAQVRRVPYRLPELVDPVKGAHSVLIVEGEGKADALAELGFLATCAVGGAGKWPLEFGEYFTGRRVIILPDNDTPGIHHAVQVAGSCLWHRAGSVRIVRTNGEAWEAMGTGADVKDWLESLPLDRAGKRQAVIDLVRQCGEWSIRN